MPREVCKKTNLPKEYLSLLSMFVHGILKHFKDNEVCKVNSVLRTVLQ